MNVYRVYNGWMGASAVHRIVVAETRADAVEAAIRSGMKDVERVRDMEHAVELVCEAAGGAVEAEDYSG